MQELDYTVVHGSILESTHIEITKQRQKQITIFKTKER